MVALIALIMVVTAACSSGSKSARPPTSAPSHPTTSSPQQSRTSSPATSVPLDPGEDPGHVVPPSSPGTSTPMPTEVPGKVVPALFASGQEVAITTSGFEPQRLYCAIGHAVVWTNVTKVDQQVILNDGQIHSGPIPPGGEFVWKPDYPIGIGYHSATGAQGVLTVQVTAT